jgi:hypothetical protein
MSPIPADADSREVATQHLIIPLDSPSGRLPCSSAPGAIARRASSGHPNIEAFFSESLPPAWPYHHRPGLDQSHDRATPGCGMAASTTPERWPWYDSCPRVENSGYFHDMEERVMEHQKVKWSILGLIVGLGFSLAALAVPSSAHAGGIRISIGIPAPVYVAPPPVVVYPPPVIVQPAPRIVYPPPIAFSAPCDIYGRPLPRGYVRNYNGYYPADTYKFYKHGRHRW